MEIEQKNQVGKDKRDRPNEFENSLLELCNMIRILICLCLFWFSLAGAVEKSPELIFRPQTPSEAFSYIQELISQLPWFKANGYRIALPTQFATEGEENLSEEKINELKALFLTQIYSSSQFDISLRHLYDAEPLIERGFEKLSLLKENWDFKIVPSYEVVLTLYGPGGDSDSQKGTVLLFTTPTGMFKRKTGYEVLFHEIVHIGIEESIVKKYRLSHWEKERLVDLICALYLAEILPEYKMQPNGDKRLDMFVDERNIVQHLPLAIERFVQNHPR